METHGATGEERGIAVEFGVSLVQNFPFVVHEPFESSQKKRKKKQLGEKGESCSSRSTFLLARLC